MSASQMRRLALCAAAVLAAAGRAGADWVYVARDKWYGAEGDKFLVFDAAEEFSTSRVRLIHRRGAASCGGGGQLNAWASCADLTTGQCGFVLTTDGAAATYSAGDHGSCGAHNGWTVSGTDANGDRELQRDSADPVTFSAGATLSYFEDFSDSPSEADNSGRHYVDVAVWRERPAYQEHITPAQGCAAGIWSSFEPDAECLVDGADAYTQLDFSDDFKPYTTGAINEYLATHGESSVRPLGSEGVPMLIKRGSGGAAYMSWADVSSTGTLTLSLPAPGDGIRAPTRIHTIMNTLWGERAGGVYGTITATATDGHTTVLSVETCRHVRDFNFNSATWCGTVDTERSEVQEKVLINGADTNTGDMQTWLLPADEWAHRTLASLTVQDTGAPSSNRLLLAAVTVQSTAPATPPHFVQPPFLAPEHSGGADELAFLVTLSEAGATVSYLVQAAGAAAPASAADVIASRTGSFVAGAAGSPTKHAAAGLVPGTLYDVYVAASADAAGAVRATTVYERIVGVRTGRGNWVRLSRGDAYAARDDRPFQFDGDSRPVRHVRLQHRHGDTTCNFNVRTGAAWSRCSGFYSATCGVELSASAGSVTYSSGNFYSCADNNGWTVTGRASEGDRILSRSGAAPSAVAFAADAVLSSWEDAHDYTEADNNGRHFVDVLAWRYCDEHACPPERCDGNLGVWSSWDAAAAECELVLAHHPVDLSALFNRASPADNRPAYRTNAPTGGAGVPVTWQPQGALDSVAHLAAAPGEVQIAIDLSGAEGGGHYGVRQAHTVLNLEWGLTQGASLATITFVGSEGASQTFPLVTGVNVRTSDTRPENTGEITALDAYGNAEAAAVRDEGVEAASALRSLDMQTWTLSDEFAEQRLVSVTLADNGAANVQRLVLYALTLSAVPDTTRPVFSVPPSAVPVAGDSSTLRVQFALTEAATVHYAVLPAGSDAPASAAAVRAGTVPAAVASGSVEFAGGAGENVAAEFAVAAGELSAGTAHDLYFTAADSAPAVLANEQEGVTALLGVATTVPTSIDAQPLPAVHAAEAGDDASLPAWSVTASGTSLSYQWRLDGANVDGAVAATFSPASADASLGGLYDVVVTGADGTVTSAGARLVFLTRASSAPAPSARSPSSVTVQWGAPAEAGVVVTGYTVEASADGDSPAGWVAHADTGASLSRTFEGLAGARFFRVTPIVEEEGARWQAEAVVSAAAVAASCAASPGTPLLESSSVLGSDVRLVFAVPGGLLAAGAEFVGPAAVADAARCGTSPDAAGRWTVSGSGDGAADDAACAVEYRYEASLAETLGQCGFEQRGTDGLVFRGQLEFTTRRAAGSVFGTGVERTDTTGFTLEAVLPGSATVSSGDARAFNEVIEQALVSSQAWDVQASRGTWTLATSVQWPYYLEAPAAGTSTHPFDAAPAVSGGGTCNGAGEGEGAACTQLFAVTAAETDGCTVDGEITAQFAVRCRAAFGGACDALARGTAPVTFPVRVADFCARVVEVAAVSPSLLTYSGGAPDDGGAASVDFVLGTTVHGRVSLEIEGGVDVSLVRLQELDIESQCDDGCTGATVNAVDGGARDSAHASYALAFKDAGEAGGPFIDFSFQANANSVTFDADAGTGQVTLLLRATVQVTYTEAGSQALRRRLVRVAAGTGAAESAEVTATAQIGAATGGGGGGGGASSSSSSSSGAFAGVAAVGVGVAVVGALVVGALVVRGRRRRRGAAPLKAAAAAPTASSSSAALQLDVLPAAAPVCEGAAPAVPGTSLGDVASAYDVIAQ